MRLIDTEMLPWENQHMDEFGDWSLKVYEIEEMPTVDPVHATGACYCKECVHYREVSDWNGNKYKACHLNANVAIIKKDEKDFCSKGERGDTH